MLRMHHFIRGPRDTFIFLSPAGAKRTGIFQLNLAGYIRSIKRLAGVPGIAKKEVGTLLQSTG